MRSSVWLLVGAVFPILFAGSVFFHRRRIYFGWAKGASIVGVFGGLGWAGLGWILMHAKRFQLDEDMFYTLVGLKGILGGLCIGCLLAILVARPYKPREERQEEGNLRNLEEIVDR